MDRHDADLPCIVQALASPSLDPSDAPLPSIVQALTAVPPMPSSKTQTQALPAANDQPPPTPNSSRPLPEPSPPSPRRTRSGGAREWTAAETLALVAAVAAVDDAWARSVSAFQKWAIVAENLASSEAAPSSRRGRGRAASECRRRWEALAAEYGSVRRWEERTGGSYWDMSAAARRKAGLPVVFDAEVYGVMDALMRVEEAHLADAGAHGRGGQEERLVGAGGVGAAEVEEEGGNVGVGEEDNADGGTGEEEDEEAMEEEEENDSDSEGETQVNGGKANPSDDSEGCEMETNDEPKKSQNVAWELANKLNENAQHINMILKEAADEDTGLNHAYANAISPDAVETTRQKADELIKSLGGLVSYLNQFTDLIKENGFEDVVGMS